MLRRITYTTVLCIIIALGMPVLVLAQDEGSLPTATPQGASTTSPTSSPIPSASPEATQTPTPTPQESPTPAPTETAVPQEATEEKDDVLGDAKVLGETNSGKELSKWLLAFAVGLLVIFFGIRIARMKDNEE